MGERIKITESERNHIKGLYEQEETKKCAIDYRDVYIPIDSYGFKVADSKGRIFDVTISLIEETFKITDIDSYDDFEDGEDDEKNSHREVIDFVNNELQNNNLIQHLPEFINWNKLLKKVDYVSYIH